MCKTEKEIEMVSDHEEIRDFGICYLNNEKPAEVLGNGETWSDLHSEKFILTGKQIGENKSKCKETLKEAVSASSLDKGGADMKRIEKFKRNRGNKIELNDEMGIGG